MNENYVVYLAQSSSKSLEESVAEDFFPVSLEDAKQMHEELITANLGCSLLICGTIVGVILFRGLFK